MWQLHLNIKDYLPEKDEEYLINEIIKLFEKLPSSKFKEALRIIYGETFHINKTPAEFALLFVKGIKKNDVFTFESFIKGISK